MNFLIIIILAIIQGVTEFLPISSSGHLLIIYKLFNITSGTMFLSILLHFATLLAVIFYYRKYLLYYLKHFKSKTTINYLITTITTVILVFIFKNFLTSSFNGAYLVYSFILTAIIIFITDIKINCHKYGNKLSINTTNITQNTFLTYNTINYTKSFIVGISQAFAVLPGVSRSGTTISTLIILNSNKEESTNYSLMISIPIVIGSLLFEIIDFIKTPEIIPFNFIELIFGFILTFIIGYFSIKLLFKIIKKQKLYIFSFYLLILSLFLIIFNVF